MDVDPMGIVESAREDGDDLSHAEREQRKSRLNTWVAIMVALLATFMGIAKVKDDNIVQAMQQAQAKSIDTWAWYQAKKIRVQVAQGMVDQFSIQAATAAPDVRRAIEQKIASYKAYVAKEAKDLADVQKKAQGYDADYDRLNYHDDQF